MAPDDLNTPLGLKKDQPGSWPWPSVTAVAAGLLGAFLSTFALWAIFNTDPLGGEPVGVARVEGPAESAVSERRPGSEEPRSTAPSRSPERDAPLQPPGELLDSENLEVRPPQAGAAGEQIVTIIDGKSGARQEV